MDAITTALVTGAGSGIGRAVALAFLASGWDVILVGRRRGPLDDVAKTHPGRAVVAPCDLTKADEVAALAAELESGALAPHLPGSLKALVNSAGIYERASFLETSDQAWERQLTANLLAPARLTRRMAPILAGNGGGSIVNVASTLGQRPVPDTSAYSASKAGLINLTQTMALELAGSNIRVNCVCPGIVDTPIHAFHGGGRPGATPEAREALEKLGPLQPLGRVGTPEEVAAGILYFCQPLSSWTTGAVLSVDGGINLV